MFHVKHSLTRRGFSAHPFRRPTARCRPICDTLLCTPPPHLAFDVRSPSAALRVRRHPRSVPTHLPSCFAFDTRPPPSRFAFDGTPHSAALSNRRSLAIRRALCSAPVCTPSRFAFGAFPRSAPFRFVPLRFRSFPAYDRLASLMYLFHPTK